jgi:tetratricopeptide (TPR) repeat protein
LANALSFVGRHHEAVATVDEAVSKARTAGSPISLFWALGAARRAYGEGGRLDESDARLREMEALVAAQPNLPVPVHAAMARFLAQGALRRTHPDEAVTLARRALERLEAARRPPRDVLPVLLVLASALNGAAQFETARATAERAREMARDWLGEFKHSYDLGLAHLELGIAQAGLKHPDVARGWLRSALADLQETAGENAPAEQRAAERLAQLGERSRREVRRVSRSRLLFIVEPLVQQRSCFRPVALNGAFGHVADRGNLGKVNLQKNFRSTSSASAGSSAPRSSSAAPSRFKSAGVSTAILSCSSDVNVNSPPRLRAFRCRT